MQLFMPFNLIIGNSSFFFCRTLKKLILSISPSHPSRKEKCNVSNFVYMKVVNVFWGEVEDSFLRDRYSL